MKLKAWFTSLPHRVIVRDVLRAVVFVALAALLLGGTIAENYALLYTGGIMLVMAGFSHIIRRVLFNYIDLKKFAMEALKSPIGSAIVVLAVCLLLAVMMHDGVSLLMGMGR